jgi:hypothetical protein
MKYQPQPIDAKQIVLPDELLQLRERLAENAHDLWAAQRMADGWEWGPHRDDEQKQNPCLVPYDQLPDAEKEYDRLMAMETLKTILALGFQIAKAP